MAKKIQLINKPALTRIAFEYDLGVPVAQLLVKHSLNTSSPTLKRLLENINNPNLFPPWLDNTTGIAEQPATWSFLGIFPQGKWIDNNDNS